MTLHDRTTKSLLHLHKKKKPPSISAQFQVGGPTLMWLCQNKHGELIISPGFPNLALLDIWGQMDHSLSWVGTVLCIVEC